MPRIAPSERPSPSTPNLRAALQLGPALDFMRGLWRLNHAVERTSCQMERALGITAQQRIVIRCIGRQPGITPSGLAMLLHVDRSTISTALNRMERDGLLVRRGDVRDRRSITLWLSAKGKKLDRPSKQTIENAVECVLSETGARELNAAKRVMECLCRQLESGLDQPPEVKAKAARAADGARRDGARRTR